MAVGGKPWRVQPMAEMKQDDRERRKAPQSVERCVVSSAVHSPIPDLNPRLGPSKSFAGPGGIVPRRYAPPQRSLTSFGQYRMLAEESGAFGKFDLPVGIRCITTCDLPTSTPRSNEAFEKVVNTVAGFRCSALTMLIPALDPAHLQRRSLDPPCLTSWRLSKRVAGEGFCV
jgi:hypothetical protein